MAKEIREFTAAEKLAGEKKNGCIPLKMVQEGFEEAFDIKVSLVANGEAEEITPTTLFMIAFNPNEDKTGVFSNATIAGNYDMDSSMAMVRAIENAIDITPNLKAAKMLMSVMSGKGSMGDILRMLGKDGDGE